MLGTLSKWGGVLTTGGIKKWKKYKNVCRKSYVWGFIIPRLLHSICWMLKFKSNSKTLWSQWKSLCSNFFNADRLFCQQGAMTYVTIVFLFIILLVIRVHLHCLLVNIYASNAQIHHNKMSENIIVSLYWQIDKCWSFEVMMLHFNTPCMRFVHCHQWQDVYSGAGALPP